MNPKEVDEWFDDLDYRYKKLRYRTINPITKDVTYCHCATQPFIRTIAGVDLYHDDIITFDINYYEKDLANWVIDDKSILPKDVLEGDLATETGFYGVAKVSNEGLWIDFRDYHHSKPMPEVKNKGLYVWRNGDPYINYQYKWINLITNVKVIGNKVLDRL